MLVAYIVHVVDRERQKALHLRSLVAHHHNAEIFGKFGMVLLYNLTGLDKIFRALALVCNLQRAEEKQFLILRKIALLSRLFLVAWLE